MGSKDLNSGPYTPVHQVIYPLTNLPSPWVFFLGFWLEFLCFRFEEVFFTGLEHA